MTRVELDRVRVVDLTISIPSDLYSCSLLTPTQGIFRLDFHNDAMFKMQQKHLVGLLLITMITCYQYR